MSLLTSIPPTLLHRVRDAAAAVHDLAQLGLELLCPCEGRHGTRLRELGQPRMDLDDYLDRFPDGMAERCALARCPGPGWVSGASDYCSPDCELIGAAVGAL